MPRATALAKIVVLAKTVMPAKPVWKERTTVALLVVFQTGLGRVANSRRAVKGPMQ